MPSVSVEENIQKITSAIEQYTKEILRLEGSLRMFHEFKASGLETIELPHEPKQQLETIGEDAEEDEVKEIST